MVYTCGMKTKTALLYPASTEIGLEYWRSLRYMKGLRLALADSGGATRLLPGHLLTSTTVYDSNLVSEIKHLMNYTGAEVLIPCHDEALYQLKKSELGELIPGSKWTTVYACSFKSKTYQHLRDVVRTPTEAVDYPCFAKPDRGQGSRGAREVQTQEQWDMAVAEGCLLSQIVGGDEYTVDCFTDRYGKLLYAGARKRLMIKGGISTSCELSTDPEFQKMALKINHQLDLRGAWFFQCKQRPQEEPVLLEVAPRIAGSSGFARARGVNLAALTLYDHWEQEVSVPPELVTPLKQWRQLDERFLFNLDYWHLYVDLDDTLVVRGQVNGDLVKLMIQCRNQGKQVHVLTRHAYDPVVTLSSYGLLGLVDTVQKVLILERKSEYIQDHSVFIDDSFSERTEAQSQFDNVYCFGPESVPCLYTS